MPIVYFLFLLVGSYSVHAQTDSNAAPDFPSLPNPDSFKVENDFVKHVSMGWFPQPYRSHGYGIESVLNVYEWDRLSDLRSASFHPTKFGFNTSDPFASKEDKIKKKNSSDDASDDFPGEGYSSSGLFATVNVPLLNVIFDVGLSYDVSRSRLFSLDTTRSFLEQSGNVRSFKEVTVLFSNQHFLSLHGSLIVPLYGAFLESEAASTSSYYFTSFGAQAYHNIIDESTQFTQIANAKESIRFLNGTDTVTTMNKVPLRTKNNQRYYFDWALGWRFAVRGVFMMTFQAYALIPLNSVLSDAEWRQYRFGFKLGLGFESE